MIHYININKKRLVGRNNQPNVIPLAIDFHTLGTIDFAFINDCNQIKPINENLKFYLAGSKKMNKEASKLLFLSKTYTIKDNVITFTVDTYTQPFIEEITKKNTEINVEISAEADNAQQVLLRDIAYANPRVYVPGFTPPPVDPTEYYTKVDVDSLINGVKADIPTKTSELINDSGYITSGEVDFSDYYTKEETDNKLDEKADKTAIPTKTSELINDSNFVTSSDVEESLSAYQPISGMNLYALKSDIPSGGEFPSAYVSDIDHCYGSIYTVDNYGILSFMRGGNQSQRIINWNFDSLKNYASIPEYTYSSQYIYLNANDTIDYSNAINTLTLGWYYELNTATYTSNQINFDDIKMFKIYNPNGYTFKFGYLDYNSNNNFGEYDDNNQRWEKELITSSDTGVTTFLMYKVLHQSGSTVMMLNYNGQEWPLWYAY